ncbi:hypothetical protein E5S67_02765 [Microcoleus sp. IPMA8]|uniref:Uncharacterized protein n=1 Tax=Microcoleus asticus IPMA8 TaxID=2563858 RepID=A0ABX2CXA2_9CYAN|nr:hypothetical protein [Microcoleus asticus IPMA8]
MRGCSIVNNPFMKRQDACSTRDEFYCGTGILPVFENGAIFQFLQTTQTQNYDISFNAVKFGNLRQISPPLKAKFLKQS